MKVGLTVAVAVVGHSTVLLCSVTKSVVPGPPEASQLAAPAFSTLALVSRFVADVTIASDHMR